MEEEVAALVCAYDCDRHDLVKLTVYCQQLLSGY